MKSVRGGEEGEQYEVDVKRESCRMSMVSQVYCDFDVMAQKKEWNQPSLKPNNTLSLLSFVRLVKRV